MSPRPKESESDSSLEIKATSASRDADKINARLGLSGWRGQVAQFGGIAIIFGAFMMLLVWFRNDGKSIVNDLIRQQSIDRAEDRELRSQDRAEDRTVRREIGIQTAAAMDKLATAIGEFRMEIKAQEAENKKHAEKLNTAVEKLIEKVDKMK